MSTQVNIKLDAKLKKQSEELAKMLGFSLSSVLRAFLLHFVRSRRMEFSVEDTEIDTSDALWGSTLEKELIKVGYDAAYAKKQGKAYDNMLKAEKDDTLIEL